MTTQYFDNYFPFSWISFYKEYMVRIPGLKIIRVYGDLREQAEFPIPNRRQYLKQSSDDGTEIPERLKKVSLHHIIRKHPCPDADELRMYERKFEDDRKEKQRTSDQEVETYCKVSFYLMHACIHSFIHSFFLLASQSVGQLLDFPFDCLLSSITF